MRLGRLTAVYCATVLLSLAGSGTALAQQEGPYVSGDAGLALVDDIDSVVAGLPGKLEIDPGLRLGVAVGYTLASTPTYEAAVQLETGFFYNEASKLRTSEGKFSVDGDFYQVPVLADILYNLRWGPRLVPYLGVGAGGVYHRLEIENVEGFPASTSHDGFDFGLQAMVGLRYKLSEREEIGAGYKFLATFADSTVQAHSISLMYVLRF